MRVLRNTFFNAKRTEKRRPRTAAMPDDPQFAEPRASAQPERSYEASEVFDAISALPESFRDVVAAVDVCGLSYREAASALRIREGTVMSRLHRGRQQLARALSTWKGTVPCPGSHHS